jgi:hypothetical protein
MLTKYSTTYFYPFSYLIFYVSLLVNCHVPNLTVKKTEDFLNFRLKKLIALSRLVDKLVIYSFLLPNKYPSENHFRRPTVYKIIKITTAPCQYALFKKILLLAALSGIRFTIRLSILILNIFVYILLKKKCIKLQVNVSFWTHSIC